jgi:hypothetical protein
VRRVGQVRSWVPTGPLTGFVCLLALASHGRAVRSHYPASREYPLPLYQQHVPQVAPVLQGRPHTGLSPGSQVDVVAAQDGHDLGDLPTNILGDRPCLSEVVNETAVPTLRGHAAIVTDRFFVLSQTSHTGLATGPNRVANSIRPPRRQSPGGGAALMPDPWRHRADSSDESTRRIRTPAKLEPNTVARVRSTGAFQTSANSHICNTL